MPFRCEKMETKRERRILIFGSGNVAETFFGSGNVAETFFGSGNVGKLRRKSIITYKKKENYELRR